MQIKTVLLSGFLAMALASSAMAQSFPTLVQPNWPAVNTSSGSGGGSTSPGGTVTGANQYRSAGGTFAGDDGIIDNGSGSLTATGTLSATALNAINVSVTNVALNSNTLMAGESLYARLSGGALVMDGSAGYQYDFSTNRSIFSSTNLPASTTPSATVHISGTAIISSLTSGSLVWGGASGLITSVAGSGVDTNGNIRVGGAIGNSGTLDVSGSIYARSQTASANGSLNVLSATSKRLAGFADDFGQGGSMFLNDSAGNNTIFQARGATGGPNFWNPPSSALTFQNSAVVISRTGVTGFGTVGISNTNPNATLDVNGTVSATNIFISSSTAGISITRPDGNPFITAGRLGAATAEFGFTGSMLNISSSNSPVAVRWTNLGIYVGNNAAANGSIASSTLHVSGTTQLVGAVTATSTLGLTGLNTGTATNNLCITSTGQVISSTTLSGCLGVSDPALKKDIRPLAYGLAEVLATDPIMYKDIRPGNYPDEQVGFLAYSVDRNGQRYRGLEPVMPELVDPKATFYNGQYYKGVVYERAVAVSFKAIQELQAEIDELREHAGLPPKYVGLGARVKWLLTGE